MFSRTLPLLISFLCADIVMSDCVNTTIPFGTDTIIANQILKNETVLFQVPVDAKVQTSHVITDSNDYHITVVSGGKAIMSYSPSAHVISIAPTKLSGASYYCSPLVLWAGAAGATSILSGGRDVDRLLLGTTAVITASSLMTVAFAECATIEISFNVPNYFRDVNASRISSVSGEQFVSFKHHKVCSAGEWTEAAGTATKDTQCTTCSTGRFRAKPATNGKAEKQLNVCKGINENECRRFVSKNIIVLQC